MGLVKDACSTSQRIDKSRDKLMNKRQGHEVRQNFNHTSKPSYADVHNFWTLMH